MKLFVCAFFSAVLLAFSTSAMAAETEIPAETVQLIESNISDFVKEIWVLDRDCDLAPLLADGSEDVAEYYAKRRRIIFGGWEIYDDWYPEISSEIELKKLEENGDGTFTVEAVAKMVQISVRRPESPEYEYVPYTFVLSSAADGCRIVSVHTDDTIDSIIATTPVEEHLAKLAESYQRTLESLRSGVSLDPEMDRIEAEHMEAERMAVAAGTSIAYDRDAAVAYAESHYNSYNRGFQDRSPADCQNFASQCVWAGYGGTTPPANTDAISDPMVYYYNGSSARNWYGTAGDASESWVRCSAFKNYIATCNASKKGPVGWVYDRTSTCLRYAQPGDIIYIYYRDNTDGLPDHAYVVVSTENAYGSNNVNTIYVSAHTNDCYGFALKNRQYDEDEFALVRMGTWHSGSSTAASARMRRDHARRQ